MSTLHQHFNQREKGRYEFQHLLSAATKLKRTPNLSEAQQAHLEDAIRLASKQRATTVMIARCSSLMNDYVATQVERALDATVCRIDVPALMKELDGTDLNKAVSRLFADAETKHWVLLFDEADALFGKRTEVKDSHDRYANQEVSHLLKCSNQHPGMTIFTLADRLPLNVTPKRFDYLL